MAEAIVGREAELAAIEGFLDDVAHGPAALLLEGEPGIGKTTLWNAGVGLAEERSFRVLVARPVESEAKLPFTALGDLLEGLPEEALDPLPGPQRRALEVSLLREEAKGSPPQPRAVALAFLGVLRATSQEIPVVVAVDDLQWLDPSSSTALLFALRRLDREPVRLLASRREEADESAQDIKRALVVEQLFQVAVGPLGPDELDEIVQGRLGERFPRPLLVHLQEATAGNPFFAMEIARALVRGGSWPGPGDPLPVPANLRELVRERLAGLPDTAREAALVISALSRPATGVVEAYESGAGRAALGLAQGVEAGLVEFEGSRIRFTHPLLSSVVYSEATPASRREVHARLAEIVPDPEERARHLALAADGPDRDVAAALDGAAELARARGAPEAAAQLFERARGLTPPQDANDSARRGFLAAEYSFEAGDTARARSILEEVLKETPPGAGRARALSLMAWVGEREAVGLPANRALLERALREAGEDLALRAEIELELSWADHQTGAISDAAAHARLALDLANESGVRPLLAEALAGVGFQEAMLGRGIDLALMERAVALEGERKRIRAHRRPRWLLAVMLYWAGKYDEAASILGELRDLAVESGDIHGLPYSLLQLSRDAWMVGDWERARREAEESDRLAAQSSNWDPRVFSLSTRATVEAHGGNVDATLALISEGLALAPASRSAEFELRATRGFLELSRGDPVAAASHLTPLAEDVEAAGIGEPGVYRFQANAIEALIELGERERATELLDAFERQGKSLERVWALATAARCRALLHASEGRQPQAFDSLAEALGHHERLGEPFELGRTLLVQGALLRRTKRKREARAALEQALGIFDGLGAKLWSVKARTELSRIGGRAPRPLALTPTEEKVAQLASEGRTNKEIAAALYLSPKTVEANLTRIYRKLGIRSRTELARQRPEGE